MEGYEGEKIIKCPHCGAEKEIDAGSRRSQNSKVPIIGPLLKNVFSGVKKDMKCQRKPLVLDTFQFTGEARQFPEWFKSKDNWSLVTYNGVNKICVDTLEGRMFAEPGDWIIKGVAGEIWPVKPHIFEQSYNLLDG